MQRETRRILTLWGAFQVLPVIAAFGSWTRAAEAELFTGLMAILVAGLTAD